MIKNGRGSDLDSLFKEVTPKVGSPSRQGASYRKVQGRGTAGNSREVKEVFSGNC